MVACHHPISPPVVDVGISLDFDRGEPRITPQFKIASGCSATGSKTMSLTTAKRMVELLQDIIAVAEKHKKK